MSRKDVRAEFAPHFEGKETLDGLLDLAGSSLGTEDVLERFREAVAEHRAKNDVIPTLFTREPRFPDPLLARKLYENLFGLWELVLAGRPIALEKPARPAKPAPPQSPGHWGASPDAPWVERAWKSIEGLDEKAEQRLEHAFENRQDALLAYLDELGLSDNAFAQARELLFELWAMMEVGAGKELRSLTREELASPAVSDVPAALCSFVEEALFEAEQDEKEPLSVEESGQVKQVVSRALSALWNARGS